MPTNLSKGDKKKALIAYKDKLLTEIYYYDKRIEEARQNLNKPRYFEDDLSSDSDSELSLAMDSGPPIQQLKTQQAMLKTCLQATQELTSLEVLQSEVNVLVQAPVFDGESPINEPGTWREVTAECCVDLVPFSITFYAHCGDAKFSPVSFRGLKVTPLKASHEAELVNSVLPGLKRPSDAVEVLRSYALAHRSRRSTLARLAEKFVAALSMELMETGGYLLKCADLLEVTWTLQNKWSPIAPFHHRLKFDLEYIDESYLKTITQAHRQLSDPSVDTDERTILLAKIISTCLEAKPLEPDSSDQEAGRPGYIENSPMKDGTSPDKRRTTLDREPEVPNMKKKKDSEVMAPPKYLPKKIKPSNKSPSDGKIVNSRPSKRAIQDEPTGNVKKPKINDNVQENPENEVNAESESVDKNSKSVASGKTNVRSATSGKNKNKITANTKSDRKINDDTAKINSVNEEVASQVQKSISGKKVEKPRTSNKNPANTEKSNDNPSKKGETAKINSVNEEGASQAQKSESAKKVEKPKISNKNPEKLNDNTGKKGEMEAASIVCAKKDNAKNVATKSALVKRKSTTNIKSNNVIGKQENAKRSTNSAPSTSKQIEKSNNKNDEKESKISKNSNNAKKVEAVEKQASNKGTDGNVIKMVNNVTNDKGEVIKKVVKKLANNKPKVAEKVGIANEQKSNLSKKSNIGKVESSESVKKGILSADKNKKPLIEQNTKTSKTANQNTLKKDFKNPPKVSLSTALTGNIKKTITATTEKENTVQSKTSNKSTKIPQKKIGTPKKMIVRVSPRKTITMTKLPLTGNKNVKKIVQKPVTGIPKLLTKPKPKVM